MGSWRPEVGEGSSLSVNCPRAVWLFVHCDDSWVVVDCPGLTLSYIGLVPF